MNKELNMVDFCLQLLENFVGLRMSQSVGLAVPLEHIPVKLDSWAQCAYCAIYSKISCTRVRCNTCLVPLCSIAHGRKDTDCFALAHKSKDMKKMVKAKHTVMQNYTKKMQGRVTHKTPIYNQL